MWLILCWMGQYKGLLDCVRCILEREGFCVFYCGYFFNVLGIIFYVGIDLVVYEILKNWWFQQYSYDLVDLGIFVFLVCGIIFSICGQIVSYLLVLVWICMQV